MGAIVKSLPPVRLHWDAETGWVVDLPTTVSDAQLQRICEWAVPRQIDRWRGLPPGDRKDELERAIKLLQAGQLTQRVVEDRDGCITPFKSTERTNAKVTSYG